MIFNRFWARDGSRYHVGYFGKVNACPIFTHCKKPHFLIFLFGQKSDTLITILYMKIQKNQELFTTFFRFMPACQKPLLSHLHHRMPRLDLPKKDLPTGKSFLKDTSEIDDVILATDIRAMRLLCLFYLQN